MISIVSGLDTSVLPRLVQWSQWIDTGNPRILARMCHNGCHRPFNDNRLYFGFVYVPKEHPWWNASDFASPDALTSVETIDNEEYMRVGFHMLDFDTDDALCHEFRNKPMLYSLKKLYDLINLALAAGMDM